VLVRFLTLLLDGCAHGGGLSPLRTIAPGIEVWLCRDCGREVVCTDA
jgi:hypothetical protein